MSEESRKRRSDQLDMAMAQKLLELEDAHQNDLPKEVIDGFRIASFKMERLITLSLPLAVGNKLTYHQKSIYFDLFTQLLDTVSYQFQQFHEEDEREKKKAA